MIQKNKQSIFRELLEKMHYSKSDPKLNRYMQYELKKYIINCCETDRLIEAYVLVCQYVDSCLLVFIQDSEKERNQAATIWKTMYSAKLVSHELYSLYREIHITRNKLVHSVLNNLKKLRQVAIKKRESHKEALVRLINLTDETFIKLASKFPDRFVNMGKSKKNNRFLFLYKILLIKVFNKLGNDITKIDREKNRKEAHKLVTELVRKTMAKDLKAIFSKVDN
jgi:hypothetical protein